MVYKDYKPTDLQVFVRKSDSKPRRILPIIAGMMFALLLVKAFR